MRKPSNHTYHPMFDAAQNLFVALPLDLESETDGVYLISYSAFFEDEHEHDFQQRILS